MTDLMEQPYLIVGLGVLLVIILISGWIKTGNSALLPAIAVAVLVFGGLLLAERMYETDREQVKAILYDVVADVENNDVEGVLAHIHSGAKSLQVQVDNVLRSYTFTEARVTQVKSIEVEPKINPPRATIEFTGRGRLEETGDNRAGLRFVILQMRKEDGDWRIFDFEDRPFQEAFQRPGASRYN